MPRNRSSRTRHRKPGTGAPRRRGHKPNLQQTVSEYLADRPHASFRMRDIVREFATSPAEEKEIRRVVHALHSEGRLRRVKGKRFEQIVDEAPRAIGPISVTEGGAGFVTVPGHDEDVFVAPGKRMGARHGDRVEVAVTGKGRYGRKSGRVVRIVERDDTPIVGHYIALPGRGGGLVYPDNPRIPGPIKVLEGMKRGAKHDDRVQVKLEDFTHPPHGRVTRVFGPADDSRARLSALLAANKFPEQFAQAAEEEAASYTNEMTDSELAARSDFRDRLTITIDPAGAKDFDDALSLRRLKNGNYELGVHIADVSWYVRPGTPLDRDARARATSVYSSHGTSPMLPHSLSSDLCSLVEGEDRRTMSVLMTITPDGDIIHAQPHRSVIRSGKRLTYEQAQEMLERGRKTWSEKPPPLRKNSVNALVWHLGELGRALRKRRFSQGGLNLDLPEYEVHFDNDGEISGIHKRRTIETNNLVEECMLAANKAVTEFVIHSREKNPRVFIFRIHDKPDPEKLQDLLVQLDALGIEWPFSQVHLDNIPSRKINDWLQSLEGNPLGDVVRYLTLRTMAKAVYDTENIGHYGLGFTNYTHFTSPIRRYPDLEVHRILNAVLEGKTKYGPDKREQVQKICDISSERERAAQFVERDSLKIRQAEFFAKKVGEEFDGMIVGAIPKGVFVEIDDSGAQGLVTADDLGAVYFDKEVFGFVEITGDAIYRPGKRMRVRVLEADPDTGRLELEPAD